MSYKEKIKFTTSNRLWSSNLWDLIILSSYPDITRITNQAFLPNSSNLFMLPGSRKTSRIQLLRQPPKVKKYTIRWYPFLRHRSRLPSSSVSTSARSKSCRQPTFDEEGVAFAHRRLDRWRFSWPAVGSRRRANDAGRPFFLNVFISNRWASMWAN